MDRRGVKYDRRHIHGKNWIKELNYKLLIFNAVVKGNDRAICLYTKLGFHKVGEIPNGFLLKDGKYQDTIIFYHSL